MSGTWIVVIGSLIDTVEGGGFEFIGPFEDEAEAVAYKMRHQPDPGSGSLAVAIELLRPYGSKAQPPESK